jgi:hypothetical protein
VLALFHKQVVTVLEAAQPQGNQKSGCHHRLHTAHGSALADFPKPIYRLTYTVEDPLVGWAKNNTTPGL